MKYDFESIIERHGQDALAVDMPAAARESGEGYFGVPIKDGFDAIPMWVADMNFAAAPSITGAIKKRLDQAKWEYTKADQYDYLVVNDNVNKAVEEILSIMTAEKCKTKERVHFLKED